LRLRVHPLRFWFEAREAILFPAGRAGNMVRGALGLSLLEDAAAYERIFAPQGSEGPSGVRQRPRPFVLRVRGLEGRSVEAGEGFAIALHLFDTREETAEMLAAAMERMGEAGMGPGRGRAAMTGMERDEVELDLAPEEGGRRRVVVRFVTPVELKGAGGPAEFGVLAARIRDRVSLLRQFYGEGPLNIDFRGFGERARRVETARCAMEWVEATRRSSRTGQEHGIGGWVGEAEYEGELGEFLPYLRAARWTGVGRQTSWGKGEVEVSVPVLEAGPELG
jgi:hypothetical protein